MSRCLGCGSKGECLEFCGYTPEEFVEDIEALREQLAEYEQQIKNLQVCQCGEFDVEFNVHCNACVKDQLNKKDKQLANYEQALGFYADNKNWFKKWGHKDYWAIDGSGDKAREVLAKYKAGRDE